jgi:hypothetical protein
MSVSVELGPETVLAPHPACFVREEEAEGGFLINADNGRVYLLNPTAVAVWELLDGRRNVADVVAELRAQYPDSPDEAQPQVLEHLNMMCQIGAVGTVGA